MREGRRPSRAAGQNVIPSEHTGEKDRCSFVARRESRLCCFNPLAFNILEERRGSGEVDTPGFIRCAFECLQRTRQPFLAVEASPVPLKRSVALYSRGVRHSQ